MKKTNNKGFSLVELIIVIAIMVILVAVIAPQYTKFVQKSRVSADVNTAADMATAFDVAIAEGKAPFGSVAGTNTVAGSAGQAIGSVSNLTKFPVSKLDKAGTNGWKIYGNDTDGVSKIEVYDASTSGYIVVYPSTATAD